MWSVGVLLYILITGHPPFEGKTIDELYEKISKGEFIFNGREWDSYPDAKNLIYSLL
jgi:serine/threonine protein kinase